MGASGSFTPASNLPATLSDRTDAVRLKGRGADDEVVGTVAARAGVLRVHSLDESARQLEVAGPGHARKIGSQEPRCSRLVASTSNVARELAKPLVACRCTLVPDNHRRPAKRSAARRTWMMESRSSRFSLL
jgi:hypothetical protein